MTSSPTCTALITSASSSVGAVHADRFARRGSDPGRPQPGGSSEVTTLNLANEYAQEKIRFNAVAPGVVEKCLHKGNLKARSPMGTVSEPKDIADVVYLTEAGHVTGEGLHLDDGAHVGRW